MLLSVLVVLLIGITNAGLPLREIENANHKNSSSDYLLPDTLQPSLYEIELEPDLQAETFNGSVRITFLVKASTNKVVLHASDLEIDNRSISLVNENGETENSVIGTVASNDDMHFYTITFQQFLLENHLYVLVINSFSGILGRQARRGFYVSSYIENGIESKVAATHFEPIAARRALPCFDEPALKAQFEVTIIRGANYSAISNSPKISTREISNGRFKDKFAKTVKMSTYLLAFVVANLAHVDELNHRVFARPSAVEDGRCDYALKTGIRALNIISEFVNMAYTLEKIDHVALPTNSSGGMENWGLILYGEHVLLYSPQIDDSADKRSVASLIAHELVHQWFGNLVSPTLWRYLWLKEGFATYLSYLGAAEVEEDIELMVTGSVHFALYVESTRNTTSMNEDLGPKPLFGIVAYDKAGSVIRMVEGFISTEVFRRGLNIYLTKMQFKAAQPSDLYTSWQQALDEENLNPLPQGEDVSSVLSTWDSNAGYPLITVTRNYANGLVTFTQGRYLSSNPNNTDEAIWYVPISYITGENIDSTSTVPKLWLTTRNLELHLEDLAPETWLLVNIQQSGYYRVTYDTKNWYSIVDFLNSENFDQIHRLNRAQLLDDSWNLANDHVIDCEIPLILMNYISRETDYIPLNVFMNKLTSLDYYTANTDLYKIFQKYILGLLHTAVNSVGFDETDNERLVTKLNRINLLTWSCKYGSQDCRENALRRLREWQEDDEKIIEPDLMRTLLCAAIRSGGQSDWDFVYKKYVAETNEVVRRRLKYALGCSDSEDILNRFLTTLLDTNNKMEFSEKRTILTSFYNASIDNRNYVYTYIKNKWSAFNLSFTSNELSELMSDIVMGFNTKEQLNDLETFTGLVEAESVFSTAVDALTSNVNTENQFRSCVLKWLRENVN